MKHLSVKLSAVLLMTAVMMSCNCNTNSKSCNDSSSATATSDTAEKKSCCAGTADTSVVASKSSELTSLTMANFEEKAQALLGKKVKISGWVSHVCSHSGKKCFITDKEETMKIRVEAKGEINGFNKELSGSEIIVAGIVRESKISKENIAEWEATIKAKAKAQKTEDGTEHCTAEIGNINKMKSWMVDNKKDFYPVYFIDGMSYEEVN